MIGQRIGSYRVERQLGQGGMGAVYAAVHEQLGRRAAIKVILPGLSRDQDNARRLLREARADQPGAAPGHRAHLRVRAFDDARYIVMEYLAGESWGRACTGPRSAPACGAAGSVAESPLR